MRLLFLAILLFSPLAKTQEGGKPRDVHVVEIRGTINPSTAHYLNRAVELAEEADAQFVLVELDTPGGLVSSVREMAQTIDRARIPVVVYTHPAGASATSAGAILMISSHLAAMAPGSNVGAAHPVGARGEDVEGAMGEKAVNDISAFARSMATLRKRNAKAAADVVSKSESFTAEEALKANLIEVVAATSTELFQKIDGRVLDVGKEKVALQTSPAPPLRPVEMTIGEKILDTLSHPNIAAILMTLGIMLIYAELSAPGLGFPGILGGLCLLVAFMSFQVLPIQTGGLILIAIGVALLAAEIFTGAGGVFAVGGSVALVLGLFWVIDPSETDLRISPGLIWGIGFVLGAFTLLLVYGAARTRRQAEETRRRIGGGDSAGLRGFRGRVTSLDSSGRAGQALLRGELWKFVSDETLNENDPVEVVSIDGLELAVRKAKE